MRNVIRGWACAFALSLAAAASHAIVLGATDTFEDGSTNGWTGGANNPTPPTNVATGGPAGAGDSYLLAASSGSPGPGGRLVVIAGPQWTGDYTAAGVNAITMDLNNLGPGDLNLRLVLYSGADTAISISAVVVPAGSGWVQARFSLDPVALIGSPLPSVPGTLSAVSGMRLFHGNQALFPGDFAAAQLGVDNVAAVPEPASALLLAGGLLALGWRRRRRRSAPLG